MQRNDPPSTPPPPHHYLSLELLFKSGVYLFTSNQTAIVLKPRNGVIVHVFSGKPGCGRHHHGRTFLRRITAGYNIMRLLTKQPLSITPERNCGSKLEENLGSNDVCHHTFP